MFPRCPYLNRGHVVARLIEARRSIFQLINRSSRSLALGTTQPVTEESTTHFLGDKGRLAHKADNFTTIFETTVRRKCGSLDVSQPYEPPLPVTDIALPHFNRAQ
jgi:hypothetical protein